MRELRARLRLDILLNDAFAGTYDTRERLIVLKQPGESMGHVVMKVLGWMLHYCPGIQIERRVGQHYKPDVVALDDVGVPTVWIDCGMTSARKLAAIIRRNPDTRFVIVKRRLSKLRRYIEHVQPDLPEDPPLHFLAFDNEFVPMLAEQLLTRHRLEATVTPDRSRLYLDVDGMLHETALYWRTLADEPLYSSP